jgi:hypothetical protein
MSKRNIALRRGAHTIKRYDGEPRPEAPRDPNARSWSVHFIGGKRLGIVEAVDEAGAVEAAAALFGLDNLRRRWLAVRSLGKSPQEHPDSEPSCDDTPWQPNQTATDALLDSSAAGIT